MKKLLVVLLLAVVAAGVTLPLWASCDLQSEVCSRWCGIRHYDSSIKAAACRAECVGKRLSCLATAGGVNRR